MSWATKSSFVTLGLIGGLIGIGVLVSRTFGEDIMFKAIPELRVRMTPTLTPPDPTDIQSTGDWYFLDHISGGLASYDADKKKFGPLYAESWSTSADGTHRFQLREGIRFHDGTPITVKDVLWSLKRHLIRRTSTHFPLWEYIVGCDGLKELTDECEGLQARSETEIEIRLKTQNESFFLQLASPETGIWSAADMDPRTLKLQPTKFSGPYFFAGNDEESALLKRNENSPLSQKFPDAPRRIRLLKIAAADLNQALVERKIDLTIRPYSPFGEPDWSQSGVKTQATTASNIFYLFGLGTGDRPAIGRDLIETLWRINQDAQLSPSESFLPFAKNYGLSKDEFLASLPEKSAPRLRIFCPDGFFASGFLDQIKKAGEIAGIQVEFFFAPAMEWFKAFNDPSAKEKYDYVLSLYAASERYPAVQLRYMTKKLVTPPIDLKLTESPDLDIDRASILRDYQKWLLQSRQATPLYFGNTLFLHQENIDLGNQSESDAEIELWRVREKATIL